MNDAEENFDIGVLVGDNQFHFFELEDLGGVNLAKEKAITLEDQVITKFAVD